MYFTSLLSQWKQHSRNNSLQEIDSISTVGTLLLLLLFFFVFENRLEYYFLCIYLRKWKIKGTNICTSIANVYLCSTVRLCIQSLGAACNIIWILPYLSIRLTYSRRNSEKIILSKVCTNLNIHILFLYVLYSRNYMFSQPSSQIHIFYHGAYILYTCSSTYVVKSYKNICMCCADILANRTFQPFFKIPYDILNIDVQSLFCMKHITLQTRWNG